MLWTKPHHGVPSQEVRNDFFVNIVHQSSWILVVVSSVNKELLPGILINQGADLETRYHESENNGATAGYEL